ncbi:cation:proton antiporter [Streptomyces sp. NPDC054765]
MTAQSMMVLLVDMALIVALAQLLGRLVEQLGQPAVMGEIVAGILLGPTLLQGALSQTLFPPEVVSALSALANVGVVLFMFLVGCEFELAAVRRRVWATTNIALGATLVPFGCGVTLAFVLSGHQPPGQKTAFVLFLGVAIAATAFPVLSRVLRDRGMTGVSVGQQALASAAVGDALVWTLLAGVVAMAHGGRSHTIRLLLVLPFVLVLFGLVRPLLRTLFARTGEAMATHRRVAVFAGLLVSSAAAQWMGLDAIFGAFLFGVAVPKESKKLLHTEVTGTAEQMAGLLLPIYFTVTGLTVNLTASGISHLGELGLVLVVAVGSKVLGTYPTARLHGFDRRHSAVLATLMNTRGLTEIVILSVGLRAGLLDRDMYSLLIAMAVLTTMAAGPILRLLYPLQRVHDELVKESQHTEISSDGAGHNRSNAATDAPRRKMRKKSQV